LFYPSLFTKSNFPPIDQPVLVLCPLQGFCLISFPCARFPRVDVNAGWVSAFCVGDFYGFSPSYLPDCSCGAVLILRRCLFSMFRPTKEVALFFPLDHYRRYRRLMCLSLPFLKPRFLLPQRKLLNQRTVFKYWSWIYVPGPSSSGKGRFPVL